MISEINSLREMGDFAVFFAKKVKVGDTLFLNGNLGAGKTTLTSLLCKELGVKENVISPTYTISREYTTGCFPILHIDLYRIAEIVDNKNNSVIAGEIGVILENSYYNDITKEGIAIIEWGSSIMDTVIPRWEINISSDFERSEEYRKIEYKYYDK